MIGARPPPLRDRPFAASTLVSGKGIEVVADMVCLRLLVTSCWLIWLLLQYSAPAFAQGQGAAQGEPQIQDNSFFVEEAYNQERGVVQHISTFSRMWNSKDWAYSFTQEWPGPGNW